MQINLQKYLRMSKKSSIFARCFVSKNKHHIK